MKRSSVLLRASPGFPEISSCIRTESRFLSLIRAQFERHCKGYCSKQIHGAIVNSKLLRRLKVFSIGHGQMGGCQFLWDGLGDRMHPPSPRLAIDSSATSSSYTLVHNSCTAITKLFQTLTLRPLTPVLGHSRFYFPKPASSEISNLQAPGPSRPGPSLTAAKNVPQGRGLPPQPFSSIFSLLSTHHSLGVERPRLKRSPMQGISISLVPSLLALLRARCSLRLGRLC